MAEPVTIMNSRKLASDGRIAVPRSVFYGDPNPRDRTPPLLRSEIPERPDDGTIEVPIQALLGVDRREIRVLHVDDEPSVGELTEACLERTDNALTVNSTTSVVEALNTLETREFDCIISDYDMPNTDGIEFLEIVRERYPDLPFILFTGKGSEEVASEAIAAGVTDYMQKERGTEQYEVLANRVKNVVDRYRGRQRFWQALSWYQQLVEQDLAGVFIAQDREFIYVNERLAEIFGYTQSELVGRPPTAIAADASAEDTLCGIADLEEAGAGTFRHEFTGQRADGTTLPVELHGGTIEYKGAPGCIGILWDRTDGS